MLINYSTNMKQNNIRFLEQHRNCLDEINQAGTATRANKIKHELHRIMKEEFLPGYEFSDSCGDCLFNMTRLLYRKFDEYMTTITDTAPMQVTDNFPVHSKPKRRRK